MGDSVLQLSVQGTGANHPATTVFTAIDDATDQSFLPSSAHCFISNLQKLLPDGKQPPPLKSAVP